MCILACLTSRNPVLLPRGEGGTKWLRHEAMNLHLVPRLQVIRAISQPLHMCPHCMHFTFAFMQHHWFHIHLTADKSDFSTYSEYSRDTEPGKTSNPLPSYKLANPSEINLCIHAHLSYACSYTVLSSVTVTVLSFSILIWLRSCNHWNLTLL